MERGFSLIELMIAVAVVALLAGIALPAYQDSVRSSRRADGRNSLMAVQLAQEKWRANNVAYGTLSEVGAPAASHDGYYTISIVGNDSTGYVAEATPVAGKSQERDTCGKLSLTVRNANTTYSASGGNAARCWSR